MKTLFWLSFTFLVYAYFGYPLLMHLLLRMKKTEAVKKAYITPFISLVIAAYNEEKNIGAKLNEILNTDYPKDKMEIVVVSDCSTDRTDEIVQSFTERGVKLFRLEQRTGKIGAYHQIVPTLKGKIIIFSDATSLLTTNSITQLISNFNDETVGCAGGLLMYVNPKMAAVGRGERKYWTYEKKIRDYENSLASLTSVSGTLYAVRKELFPLDMKDYLADDLIVPFNVVRKGYRVVLEKQALCKEYTTLSEKEEMSKRIRITLQNIRGLLNQAEIMNPFKYGMYAFLVISHKLFRLLVPVLLITVFITNFLLITHSRLFIVLFIFQILFYLGSWVGYRINKKVKLSLGNNLSYFCLSNMAILIGILRFFSGVKIVTWETMRTEY